jgi:hypothetical protein
MKPVYFSYVPGAGGKSLINCLRTSNDVYFNEMYRVDRLLATVPPLNHTEFWSTYEIHNPKFCNCDGPDPTDDNWGSLLDQPMLDQLNTIDQYVPFVTHCGYNIDCYRKFISAGPVIKIVPEREFVNLAISLKWNKVNGEKQSLCLDEFKKWEDSMVNQHVDLVLHDFNPLKDTFFEHLEQVAALLNIQVEMSGVELYLNKYRNYHIFRKN